MGATEHIILPLAQAAEANLSLIGGKAANLAQMLRAGFRVPLGYCVTTHAYQNFLETSGLKSIIERELERKPMSSMRWEEIWDGALRIRTAFLASDIPTEIVEELRNVIGPFSSDRALAVRSSSPSEDSQQQSFAGLHESFLNIRSEGEFLRALRLVWASLWSDAALLYRKELGLDPSSSAMAVLIQEMIEEDCSGVAFGCDPRHPELPRIVVEAVPGLCSELVDGAIDPDQWILERKTGRILECKVGERSGAESREPLLACKELHSLRDLLVGVENHFRWTADMEWTGREEHLVVLQARPVSTAPKDEDQKRKWYLELRLKLPELRGLAHEVSEELIPKLEALGQRLVEENLTELSANELALVIEERLGYLKKWRNVYYDKFIPFAHGVRYLGTYYNTVVQPSDAFEFVKLLRGETMLASKRNEALRVLAAQLSDNAQLKKQVADLANTSAEEFSSLRETEAGERFLSTLNAVLDDVMDVAYQGERISSRPELVVHTVLEMSEQIAILSRSSDSRLNEISQDVELERCFLAAVGEERRGEAEEILRIGRLSWRLRDDDNLLLGKVESQYLRALQCAVSRLKDEGRLECASEVLEADGERIVDALRNSQAGKVVLSSPKEGVAPNSILGPGETPRQLVGQPASSGFSEGRVRCVRSMEDLAAFRAGEIIVCDAIQPMMTHLVPLASAIIERRGGMLIHGAIISRELGIPCVNGVTNALEFLEDGFQVSVDGDLGIVTVGEPDFSLEGID